MNTYMGNKEFNSKDSVLESEYGKKIIIETV